MKTHTLASLLFLSASFAQAGDAYFSPDGKTVTYVSPLDQTLLQQVQLETKKLTTIPLALPKDETVQSLTAGAEGEALLLTEKAAWVHDAKGTRKLCDLGKISQASDLAAAPGKHPLLADWLFLAGTHPEEASRRIFFARKPGEKTFKPTFCRRTHQVNAGAFSAEGRFFFAAEGDLWEGDFEPEDGEGMMTTLSGVRIAPLAFLNTDGANGGSLYVDHLMPVGSSIYVALRGHHMGQLLRIAMSTQPALNEKSGANDDLKSHYAFLAKNLASVQIIEGSGEPIFNSAAIALPDTERVFYSHGISNQHLFLWDKATGKTSEVTPAASK